MFYDRNTKTPEIAVPPVICDSDSSPSSDTTTVTDDMWYPIGRLLNHKKIGNKDYYLVKWQDSSGSQSWEPAENITQYAIEQYIIELSLIHI